MWWMSSARAPDQRSEARNPNPSRLASPIDAARGLQVIEGAQAERDARIQRDCMLDDGMREAEAEVRGRLQAALLQTDNGLGRRT